MIGYICDRQHNAEQTTILAQIHHSLDIVCWTDETQDKESN